MNFQFVWHKNVHGFTNSFPLKCPGSSNTLCPLFSSFLTEQDVDSWGASHVLALCKNSSSWCYSHCWIIDREMGGFGILIQNTRKRKNNRHHRTSGFAHICKKNAIFHLRQGLKLCFPLFGKDPLKRSHLSKAPVFTLFLNISCEAFDCKMKAIHPFRFSF